MTVCVVIAQREDTRNVIAASLKSLGMEVAGLASLGELPSVLEKMPVCGILLELATSIKASRPEKEATNDQLQLYPFARFKIVGKEIRVLGKGKSLATFVQHCRQFTSKNRESRNLV